MKLEMLKCDMKKGNTATAAASQLFSVRMTRHNIKQIERGIIAVKLFNDFARFKFTETKDRFIFEAI